MIAVHIEQALLETPLKTCSPHTGRHTKRENDGGQEKDCERWGEREREKGRVEVGISLAVGT